MEDGSYYMISHGKLQRFNNQIGAHKNHKFEDKPRRPAGKLALIAEGNLIQ